ncbi:hypothetical protein FRZ03_02115 [Streptomyces misionensis]|uniref:MoaF-like domain-containing protein n=1 Tax=Streptomyces misionensis TaxID=67331 RepID=A0A5C6K4V8_9ACTN|nr:hypothetical protein [Streptomyces misionensis]TWV57406.1 hypothetical protein FRZ03_02115 [Streptomyces misionensis]
MRNRVGAAMAACAVALPGAAPAYAAPSGHEHSIHGSRPTALTPVGHTFVVTVDSGLVARQEFSADAKKVTITVLDPGRTSVPVGFTEAVPVYIGRVAHGVYQVSWIEDDGVELSNVQNLRNGTERVFYTYTGTDGKRHGSEHSGALRGIS